MFQCDNSFRVRVLNIITQCSTTLFPVLYISVPLRHAQVCKYRPTLVSKPYIPYTNVQTKHETIHSAIISHDIHRAAKMSLLNFLSLFRDLQKPTRFSGGGG